MEDVKKAIDTIGSRFEEFKKVNDQRLAEIEKRGAASAATEEKLAKIEADLSAAQAVKEQVDRIETALKRAPMGAEGKSVEDMETEAKHREALTSYMRTGDVSKLNSMALEGKDLTVQNDTEGGYLVTADMSGRISQIIFETSPVRSVASVQSISTDALEGLFDDTEAGAEWVGETTAPTNTTTPTLGQWRIPVHEMATKPKATNKLLEDASINVEQWLSGKVANKFARTESTAFVTGDGANKPRGFLSYAASSTADVYERGTIGQVETATASTVAMDDIIELTYAIKGDYRARARFAMNRGTFAVVRKLKDAVDGQYLWQPSTQVGQPATLMGIPTIEFNDMPDVADSALVMALADWGMAYQIVDRLGISTLRDPFSSKPYVEFYTRRRVGGAVVNFDAIKLLKVKAA